VIVDEADDASALVAAFASFIPEDGGGAVADPTDDNAAAATPVAASAAAVHGAAAAIEGRSVSEDFLLMPAASHLALSMGIDVSSLAGSGKGGRITKGDILAAVKQGTTFPQLPKREQPAAAAVSATASGGAGAKEASAATAMPAAATAAAASDRRNVGAELLPPPVAVGAVLTTNAPGEDTKASTMRKVQCHLGRSEKTGREAGRGGRERERERQFFMLLLIFGHNSFRIRYITTIITTTTHFSTQPMPPPLYHTRR
jgi:pyruvate/2-oxoglutarate dehydrogenase complex dihydrolipoamide acyltransferase (E2) component